MKIVKVKIVNYKSFKLSKLQKRKKKHILIILKIKYV